MPELMCPVCGQPLTLMDRTDRCPKNHCFDRAKSGYVNLLPPSPAASATGTTS